MIDFIASYTLAYTLMLDQLYDAAYINIIDFKNNLTNNQHVIIYKHKKPAS